MEQLFHFDDSVAQLSNAGIWDVSIPKGILLHRRFSARLFRLRTHFLHTRSGVIRMQSKADFDQYDDRWLERVKDAKYRGLLNEYKRSASAQRLYGCCAET